MALDRRCRVDTASVWVFATNATLSASGAGRTSQANGCMRHCTEYRCARLEEWNGWRSGSPNSWHDNTVVRGQLGTAASVINSMLQIIAGFTPSWRTLLMTSPRPSHDMWHGRDRRNTHVKLEQGEMTGVYVYQCGCVSVCMCISVDVCQYVCQTEVLGHASA